MGWSSGTRVMEEIIKVVEKELNDFDTKVKLYDGIIEVLENEDWDTQGECLGESEAFDFVSLDRVGRS